MTGRGASVAATIGFMLGMAVMAFLSHGAGWRRRHPNPEKLVKRFTREFSLTAEQQSKFRAILGENGKKLDAVHDETRAKLSEIRQAMRAEMRAALDLEQQKKFDEKSARWDARRKEADPKNGG